MAIPFFRRSEVRKGSVITQFSPGHGQGETAAPEPPHTTSARKTIGVRLKEIADMSAPTPGSPRLCRQKTRAMVHKYAAFGTAWAILPVPIATSAGLTALETHMLYWIARAYGEEPTKSDVVMAAGGLELCSVALKTAAIEGANLIPVVGWGVKAAIAGSAIEAIGNAAILHYESKYPGKAA
jgi:uncharacterized protein (DUF697 family)